MPVEPRVCPHCKKAFYAHAEGGRVKCFHCGYVLHDRRNVRRFRREVDFLFYYKGARYSASLMDYSHGGISMAYKGLALTKNEALEIDIDELNIHARAKTVWSKRLPGSISVSGLKLVSFILVLITCAFLAGSPALGAEAARKDPEYVIGPEDVLEISVWKNEDLSKVVTVRPDGKISLPLIGDVTAKGLTPTELTDAIVVKLKEYQKTVVVSVIVNGINSYKIFVFGDVNTPGAYTLKRRTTLLQAIAMAGGFNQFASKNSIVVVRETPDGGTKKINVRIDDIIYKDDSAGRNIILKPGDTIFVP